MSYEPFTEISFYIVAHADDWQLFMQPNAYKDLVASHKKVVFIITTAGDAGLDKTYWAAREEGCKSSIRFRLAPLTTLLESISTRDFNYHSISCWSANHVTCYFFRLPDGNLGGNGFSSCHNQSLSKFRDGQINNINAVDNSATYKSWQDFHNTLQAIIHSESYGIPDRCINYLNPDPDKNPNDHIDHITTGQAIQEMTISTGIRQVLFVGYSVSNAKENLQPEDLFWKAGMFAAYEKALHDIAGYSTLRESISTYMKWCLSSSDFITVNPSNCSSTK